MDQVTPDPTTGALTLDLNQDFAFEVNLARNVTSIVVVGYENYSGGTLKLILVQDSTGGRTVTWPSSLLKLAGGAITLTTGAGKRDVVCFRRLFSSAVFIEESRSLNA